MGSLGRKARRGKKGTKKGTSKQARTSERIPFQQDISKCASVEKRVALVAQAQNSIKKGFRAVFTIATYACSAHGGGLHPLSVVATNEDLAETTRHDIEVIIQRMREVADGLEQQLAGTVTSDAVGFN